MAEQERKFIGLKCPHCSKNAVTSILNYITSVLTEFCLQCDWERVVGKRRDLA